MKVCDLWSLPFALLAAMLGSCRLGAFNYDSLLKVSKAPAGMLGHALKDLVLWCGNLLGYCLGHMDVGRCCGSCCLAELGLLSLVVKFIKLYVSKLTELERQLHYV